MAYVKTNSRLSGDPSCTVEWRAGGTRTGRWCRETFDDDKQAERFRDLVNGHGQQWPPGWVKGEGSVEPDESPVLDAEKFPIYAHAYVGLLTDISDHTRTNCTRFIDPAGVTFSPTVDRSVVVGRHQRLRGRPAAIAARMRAAISASDSPQFRPARIAAPMARERPAGLRRSARGLPGSLRRASHSARFSAAVPSRRCVGCRQEWLSQVWQTVGLSVPQPSRGMTPCASWYP
ncbi:hypothetical protein ABZ023_29790 [Streptomyces sp. NPDC006367]|uniref:hypothetical protein n=1 Tax=unclassified Streptomyces TaxID=2593676 RepID=UPI0033BB245E